MTTRRSTPGREGGFTLIELLVAVAISMALTLAITLMLARFESGRRNLTSVNDASQSGAYVTYALDRLLRSAGSGYVQGWADNFGCRVAAARSSVTTLPRAAAFPAPFGSVAQTVRLAPAVVYAGAGTGGSDVIMVTTGSSGMGESPLSVLTNSAASTGLRVPATTGVRGDDLVLVYDDISNDCMVEQVAAPFTGGATQQLNFAGTYAAGTIGTAALANYDTASSTTGKPAFVALLGSTTGNRPQFHLLGVGDNATLVLHDMLQMDGSDAPVAIADGVADLRVRYGVDTGNDNIVDTWVDPASTGWTAATLQDGSAASRDKLRRILALRVAVVVRNSAPERDAVSATTLTMFPDLAAALQATRTLTAAEQQMRWRVLDFTVPLRNILLAP